jgi:replicative DNA helicase
VIHDPSAERAVLGALILGHDDPAVLARCLPILPDAERFADPKHRAIYRAIRELHDEGVPHDSVTLTRRLATHHAAAEVGLALLADLVDETATTANLVHHARLVRDAWQRREVIAQAEAARRLAEDPRTPVTATIAQLVDRLTQTHGAPARPVVPMRTGVLDVLEDLERQATSGTVLGVGTRLPDLDAKTHGFQRGELWIAAARPSVGKSSFVIDVTLDAAEVGPVLFLSAEMPAKAIRRRMLARAAGLNLWQIRDRESWDDAARRIQPTANALGELSIRIDDTRTTPAEMRAAVAEYTAEIGEPPVLVVVDYLQKLSAGRRAENRNIEIGYITGALSRLAVDAHVPVLCAAQLNRASVRDGRPRRPTMADLRDSGHIEQDADGILLMHRPTDQPARPVASGPHTELVEVIVEKNRNGETGLVPAWHDRSTGTWTALSFAERKTLRAA